MTNTPLTYRTACHPEANGRQPRHNEKDWEIRFPLEDGTMLHIQMGRISHDAFRGLLLREELDNAADEAQEAL